MNTPGHAGFALLLALLLPSCASPHDMDGDAGMRVALTDAQRENELHARTCQDARALPALLDETTRHEQAMRSLMQRMAEAQQRMASGHMMRTGHCSRARFEHMSASLTTMHGEMADHYARVRASETAEMARAECSSHAASAAAMMEGMMGDLESMPCMTDR